MGIDAAKAAKLNRMCPVARDVGLGTELLGVTANAIAAEAAGQVLLGKTITLAGFNPTSVKFSSGDDGATLLGSTTETFALTVGNTFIINPNGVGDQTWTVAGTAGVSTGDTGCSEDMTTETDTKLNIQVDDEASPTEVTFDWAGCNTGALIAAQMQTKIRAVGGVYASVTVAFSTDHYVVTSADKGTGSKVLITESATLSCTEELKLGATFGASEAAGTGDAALLSKATAAECAAAIAGLHAQIEAEAESAKIRINATGVGNGSTLVVGAGTENAVLGFTTSQSDAGAQGFGLGVDMANATYIVAATIRGNAPGDTDAVSVHNKSVSGFDLYAETAASVAEVDLLVFAEKAS